MRACILSLMAFSLFAAGCRDECDPKADPPRCDGNVAVYCPEPGVDQVVPIRWTKEDCGDGVCVTSGQSAFCALSSSPAPACDGGSEAACESDTSRFYCTEGFATGRTECLHCFVGDAGWTECQGGIASKCAVDGDCVPSLRCGNGLCTRRDAGQ